MKISPGVLDRPWIVMRQDERRRWGGDLRRHYLFNGLLDRSGARVLEDRRVGPLSAVLHEVGGRRWQVWRRRPLVATTEFLGERQLALIDRLGVPAAVDVHDDVLLQNDALGIETPAAEAASIRETVVANTGAFMWLVAPSAAFGAVAGLDANRLVVASNGTDTDLVRPGPWPRVPAVAFVSGAAPRRGIESLVEAMRLVRRRVDDVRLHLWLAATSEASRHYLEGLTESLAGDAWVEIGQTPYDALGRELGRAAVLVLPTPAHAYWDSVAPVKVFDYLAAGRPVVTTPRRETAALISSTRAGLVADGDDPESLAEPISMLLEDADRARTIGATGRAVAEREYDWRVVGRRLADDLLARIR